jgi:hypothetical protein
MSEQHYVLGLAYQAGLDEHRDFFTADELEKAAWEFAKGARDVGIFHADDTIGHVQIVESYIYRGPNWTVGDTVIKAGDWLVGGICDDAAWRLVKERLVTGWSPQGSATRRRITRSPA